MKQRLFNFNCIDCKKHERISIERMFNIIELRCCPYCASDNYQLFDDKGKGVE